ncbi:DEAD/DEAH box helicase [Emcibacter nanhaiensis]|uniref:DEAD-box ATP-dependent RNA helicase RhpA n=1 Tax=Emcibacter nanhaiensis TaxID=1505037 RepID=A0A501PPR9_9PROT|nr:DEAD/DEAH box helicase [Emcibacter nanhaiensis]TPD61786.1 DEAD/DEAH box helicase [Emcibacter nanhaiensis]
MTEVTTSAFADLGLVGPLLKNIRKEGFESPTPIQENAIPLLLEGRDMIGLAQTGGGKTAAFALPTLQRLSETAGKRRPSTPRALILAPTRELAKQIADSIFPFNRGLGLKQTAIFGGAPMGKQIGLLRQGVDVLVATPGRLLDHKKRGSINLSEIEIFILDEADRMLDMGFIHDVKAIAADLPEEHQTVLFSATMTPNVKKLAQQILRNPAYVEMEQETAVADTISHKVMFLDGQNKRALLTEVLEKEDPAQAIIFAKTKAGSDNLARALSQQDYTVAAIHGDKHQSMREKILRRFRNGSLRFLVATDVAARGIDVPGIDMVINYDLPMEPENYVHRVGRTGRNGERGQAISFCDGKDKGLLRLIEKQIDQKIEVDADHAFHVEVKEEKVGRGYKGGRRTGGRPSGKPGQKSYKSRKPRGPKKEFGESRRVKPGSKPSGPKKNSNANGNNKFVKARKPAGGPKRRAA